MLDKLTIRQAIIVEGKYDKIKLSALVDGTILTVEGFRLFKDKQKLELIKRLASQDGIIVLTDSDTAGFKLRNHIKSIVGNANIINIYIPQIEGKEPRKVAPSKEGTLGVEGMDISLLRQLFLEAGVLGEQPPPSENPITKKDFIKDGISGGANASAIRGELLAELCLPKYITANALADIINRLMTREEYNLFVKTHTTKEE